MDSEKLVEMAAKALLDSMESIVDERLYAGGLMADAVLPDLARAAVRIVVEECAKVAEERCQYCAGSSTGLPGNACENCMNSGLKYQAEELPRAIRSLSPDAKEQG